jgi:hypothetical protein
MRKNYNLSDEEFVICMVYVRNQKNNYISELDMALKNNYSDCLTDYYQKEIDKINAFEDRLSLKFKINL